MGKFNNFIVNGVVGAVVVSLSLLLLFKLIFKSRKEKDFKSYAHLLFLMSNMSFVWAC